MPTYVSDTGGNFMPAPEGTWLAVCCDVVELGIVETKWGKKDKIRIAWQLETEAGLTDEGKPLLAMARFNRTLHENSTLRPFLECWRGKKFTPDELKQFDLDRLLGACCQLQILHEENNGKTYANVKNIMPFPKTADKIRVRDYIRVQDREASPEEEEQPEETEF